MTTHLSTFITGFALSAALIMAIGAQNLFVLRQGLRGEHLVAVVLFCGLADALLVAAGVAGAGAFLAAAPWLADGLALAGAAFLGWHGAVALRRLATAGAPPPLVSERMTLGRALAAAAGFTLLNPHVYLDTVLLMGAAGAAQPEAARHVFVLGAASASFVWFAALGYGAAALAPVLVRPGAARALDAASGAIMLAFAAALLQRVVSP